MPVQPGALEDASVRRAIRIGSWRRGLRKVRRRAPRKACAPARAQARHGWRCPPDSSAGRRSRHSAMPSCAAISRALRRASARGNARKHRPEPDVITRVQVGVQQRWLSKDIQRPVRGRARPGALFHREKCSRPRTFQAGNQPQQHRLSTPGRTDQDQKLPVLNGKSTSATAVMSRPGETIKFC